jgi:hypothetical protein
MPRTIPRDGVLGSQGGDGVADRIARATPYAHR